MHNLRFLPGVTTGLLLTMLAGCSGSNKSSTIMQVVSPADVIVRPVAGGKGRQVSETFLGFSFETRKLLPDVRGQYYFRPDNHELVSLIRALGIKSLRVGGNTCDRATVAIPTEKDIDSFYAFAKAAGVQVIYNLRLKNISDPQPDAKIARYIMDHYASQTACFTIGNEPDFYFDDYDAYLAAFKKFSTAILAAAPNAKFCGPSTAGHQSWAAKLAADVPASELAFMSLHTYPGGNAQAAGAPPQARAHILSPEMEKAYEDFYSHFAESVYQRGLGARLEECNSLYNGGASNISNSFASSIWALDFMFWWAGHGLTGVNFHTGTNMDVTSRIPGGYDAFWTTPTGIRVHPISYGIKAFDIAGHGTIVPVEMTSAGTDHPNVTAYATVRGKEMYVTVMNRTSEPTTRQLVFAIETNGYKRADILMLQAPGNDAGALEGVTLGGAEIAGDGSWKGKWSRLMESKAGDFRVFLPGTSAAIVRLQR